jgi:hypothetical protein
MSMSTSIIFVNHIPVENKPGGDSFMREGPVPYPSNCKTPCCYGRGRCFCWPCMKEIMEDFKAHKKR